MKAKLNNEEMEILISVYGNSGIEYHEEEFKKNLNKLKEIKNKYNLSWNDLKRLAGGHDILNASLEIHENINNDNVITINNIFNKNRDNLSDELLKKQNNYIDSQISYLEQMLEQSENPDYQNIDEIIYDSPIYQKYYIEYDDDNVMLSENEIESNNNSLYDLVYDKLIKKLEIRGISARYDCSKDTYFFDRQELAKKGYNELLDYLDNNNINYEISRSTEAGYVPSIYLKDNDNDTILRIGNHDNGYISGFDITYNDKYCHVFNDKDYANWKDKILPIIKEAIDISEEKN